jgi:hypothetical protein
MKLIRKIDEEFPEFSYDPMYPKACQVAADMWWNEREPEQSSLLYESSKGQIIGRQPDFYSCGPIVLLILLCELYRNDKLENKELERYFSSNDPSLFDIVKKEVKCSEMGTKITDMAIYIKKILRKSKIRVYGKEFSYEEIKECEKLGIEIYPEKELPLEDVGERNKYVIWIKHGSGGAGHFNLVLPGAREKKEIISIDPSGFLVKYKEEDFERESRLNGRGYGIMIEFRPSNWVFIKKIFESIYKPIKN